MIGIRMMKWVFVVASLVGGLLAFGFFFWLLKTPPKTVMSISADSRSVSYRVINPHMTGVSFPGEAFVRESLRSAPSCLSGTLSPTLGARVDYTIAGRRTLRISFAPGAEGPSAIFASADGSRLPLTEGSVVLYGPETGCETTQGELLLPIWGEGAVGAMPVPATETTRPEGPGPLLLSGRISVFGVSRRLFGVRASLYPAGTFEAPAGSALESAPSRRVTDPILRGFAIYDPEPRGFAVPSMAVSLTTEAEQLHLRRWGTRIEPETIQVSAIASLFGDPVMVRIQATVVGITALVAFLSGLVTIYEAIRAARERRGAAPASSEPDP